MNELILMQHFEFVPFVDNVDVGQGLVGLVVGSMRLLLDQPLFLTNLLHTFL